MSGGHVEHLLSAALDGELTPDRRALVDRHLATCPACAAALADLSAAVEAVRGLGQARMPRAVRLPAAPPAVVPSRSHRWVLLPARHPWATTTAALAVAAVVAAAAVLPGRLGASDQGGPLASQASRAGSGVPGLGPAAGGSGGAPTGGPRQAEASPCAPCTSVGATCTPLSLPGEAGGSAGTPPPGFTNSVVRDDGTVTVVIATQASGYAPGATVDIYARLVSDGSGAVRLPCAYVLSPAAAAPPGGVSGAVPPTTPATALPRATVGGVPLLQVRIPQGARSGDTLTVGVEVPAGEGEAQAHQVDLLIAVT